MQSVRAGVRVAAPRAPSPPPTRGCCWRRRRPSRRGPGQRRPYPHLQVGHHRRGAPGGVPHGDPPQRQRFVQRLHRSPAGRRWSPAPSPGLLVRLRRRARSTCRGARHPPGRPGPGERLPRRLGVGPSHPAHRVLRVGPRPSPTHAVMRLEAKERESPNPCPRRVAGRRIGPGTRVATCWSCRPRCRPLSWPPPSPSTSAAGTPGGRRCSGRADAAALAGVVWMPDFPTSQAAALTGAARNGYVTRREHRDHGLARVGELAGS